MRIFLAVKIALVLALSAILATPVSAQTTPQRIRGTVVSLVGDTLTLTTRDGAQVTATLAADLTPVAMKRIAISDIKPNDFIATVAVPNKDGELESQYVAIFPESMRGAGEGHYDWDSGPNTSMTNATVQSSLSARNGQVLSLVYKGTPIDITVPKDAPILQNIPASRDDIKPGVKVFAIAQKAADGTITIQRMTVGKNGVNPPQ